MNKITKKQSEPIRFWIKLPKTKEVEKMQEEMGEWKNQTAFFLHLITTYYLTKNKNDKR